MKKAILIFHSARVRVTTSESQEVKVVRFGGTELDMVRYIDKYTFMQLFHKKYKCLL